MSDEIDPRTLPYRFRISENITVHSASPIYATLDPLNVPYWSGSLDVVVSSNMQGKLASLFGPEGDPPPYDWDHRRPNHR